MALSLSYVVVYTSMDVSRVESLTCLIITKNYGIDQSKVPSV